MCVCCFALAQTLSNPFGYFEYSNLPSHDESVCGAGLQKQVVFNRDTAQICQRVQRNDTGRVCLNATQPTFCIADSIANGQLMPYFFPTTLNEATFWNGGSTFILPSLFTTWELQIDKTVDLTAVTDDDVYLSLFVWARKEDATNAMADCFLSRDVAQSGGPGKNLADSPSPPQHPMVEVEAAKDTELQEMREMVQTMKNLVEATVRKGKVADVLAAK